MSRSTIPARDACAQWRQDPAYTAAHEALDQEFALASPIIIAARAQAGLSQAELAERMNTSQSAVAHLERPHPPLYAHAGKGGGKPPTSVVSA